MVYFFQSANGPYIYAIDSNKTLSGDDINKLCWALGNASYLNNKSIEGNFTGPRKEMITPWSTNAVEITQNMNIQGIIRMEEFVDHKEKSKPAFDPMLQSYYSVLDEQIFFLEKKPEPVFFIDNIEEYNKKEGLALSKDEIEYLEDLSKRIGRKLTDGELFGFSQVNSEHCRHKIFNGAFVIDGNEMPSSLFQLIKATTKANPNQVVSAYKDNCALIAGPTIDIFSPTTKNTSDFFAVKQAESVITIKAETHNFPTTVEPFNGAATGTGGEIRDRMAGGKGTFPIAGTAVYMTSYPRLKGGRDWEKNIQERPWLYHNPGEILLKASNGASDFGNKFGQPLICGSVFTFEHTENNVKYGFDKVIMLAGGIGYGRTEDAEKDTPAIGDQIILLGGDNYRIGMGGGAVSSVNTGQFSNSIELNAVQRSNPEMQKRAYNAVRALAESDENPIISIHDHGAGGHLNCLSELIDATGGIIYIDKLPVGDPTLSAKEIIGNESQERIGMVIKKEHVAMVKEIAERERAPFYVIGEATGDHRLVFKNRNNGDTPLDLMLEDMFGNPPKTIMNDSNVQHKYKTLTLSESEFQKYLENVLQIESVACKDYLTNKVDRSVTGRIALQQCAGELQLPLNNCGIVALDYRGVEGIATSLGHAPAVAIIDPAAGSRMAIAESLTNIVFTPLSHGLKGLSLSANWMWPCKNKGEDARLYKAVEASSEFAIQLGINIPTGKDSMSMTQKYPDGSAVLSPGTLIVSAVAECNDIKKAIKPIVINDLNSLIYWIDFCNEPLVLGGSSLAQVNNTLGTNCPTVKDASYFKKAFTFIQECVQENVLMAGHDISAGGMVTTLLEMCFANTQGGLNINLDGFTTDDVLTVLFAENPGVLVQVKDADSFNKKLSANGIRYQLLGKPIPERLITLSKGSFKKDLNIDALRDLWYSTSYEIDKHQSGEIKAKERFDYYKKMPLQYNLGTSFKNSLSSLNLSLHRKVKSGVKAAIIREKGVNGDREMAWSLYLAGFDVKDVHMTDLISGRETLDEINMLVYVGGFSNSDVLGSAKGWAGAFLYNPKAKETLNKYYARKDTLSLGVCNGCQLMIELGLINAEDAEKPTMNHNDSHKFESGFINVDILDSPSIMLNGLSGSRLGVWIAHGEGKFNLPYKESHYNIALKYSYSNYPANPNGSNYNTAGICSTDGRHLAMMPHLERSIYPWQWPFYSGSKNDEITPWMEAFINARNWIEKLN